MHLYQEGLFGEFSVCLLFLLFFWSMHLLCLDMLSEIAPQFPFIFLALFQDCWPENNRAATECFSKLSYSSDQNLPFRAWCFLFPLWLLDLQGPMGFFPYICFLWYYLCSQMISAMRTLIRLVCFSLQAALSKYENHDIWIPENEYCFFHLVLYITWGLETGKTPHRFTTVSPLPLQRGKPRYYKLKLQHILSKVLTWGHPYDLYGIGRCSFRTWGPTENIPLPSCASLCSPPNMPIWSLLLQAPPLKIAVLKCK